MNPSPKRPPPAGQLLNTQPSIYYPGLDGITIYGTRGCHASWSFDKVLRLWKS